MTCIVCGQKAKSKVLVFPRAGGPFPLDLCYAHDRELFLKGQDKFLLSHEREVRKSEVNEARDLLQAIKQKRPA